MSTRATPLPYQKEGVRLIGQQFRGRALLADEMGLGKTLQALWFFHRNPKTWPAVVVCPAVVKYAWEREASVHMGVRAMVAEGRRPPSFGFRNDNLIIINYDILGGWLKYIRRLNPRLVIFDETQYMSNPATQRAQHGKELSRGVPYVLGLSGTPLNNRPIELFTILNILRPDKYDSYQRFGYAFCKPSLDARGRIVFKGAANLGQLHEELKSTCMVRRLKKDVLKDLPPKVRTVVPLELHDPAGEYEEAGTDFLGWLARTKGTKAAHKASKNEILTRIGYLLRLAAKRKLKNAVKWLDGVLETTNEKVVVFCHHKGMVNILAKRYGRRAVHVTGDVVGRKRDAAVDQFQRDMHTRLFIGNDAARVGITLTAATVLAFFEMYMRPADHSQAEDRIHRISQNETAFIYYLVAYNTIEEWLCNLVQGKQEILSAVLDGGTVENEIDIATQLIKIFQEHTHGQKTKARR